MRKNILILGHNYATQFIDIYNQYTRLFDKDDCEITVAFLTGEPDPEVQKRTLAENVIFLNQSKKNIRTLKIKAIQEVLTLCKEKQFQVVICHRYKPTYIMMWVAQICRIPALIFVMHELGTMSSFARRMLIACLARKNMVFAGVSNAVRDDMRKDLWNIPKNRIVTLYNMIDVDLTEPQLLMRDNARLALELKPDDFVFGHIARLAHNKDQESLIHAFSLIKPYCPKAKLLIAGDGDLAMRLKQQVKSLGLDRSVIFTGFLPGGFRYMKAFDCFVLTSIQEAFGRVLLEAMIAKLPIIATKVHGIPEVVSHAGILIKAKDSAALASAMKEIYLLSHEELKERGTQAYQHALTNFSIPKFHEQFWQLPLLACLKD